MVLTIQPTLLVSLLSSLPNPLVAVQVILTHNQRMVKDALTQLDKNLDSNENAEVSCRLLRRRCLGGSAIIVDSRGSDPSPTPLDGVLRSPSGRKPAAWRSSWRVAKRHACFAWTMILSSRWMWRDECLRRALLSPHLVGMVFHVDCFRGTTMARSVLPKTPAW